MGRVRARGLWLHMRRIGSEGKSLLVDIMTLDVLLATYPELRPYLEDGSIVYFEACLTQMRQWDLQLLVEGLLDSRAPRRRHRIFFMSPKKGTRGASRQKECPFY